MILICLHALLFVFLFESFDSSGLCSFGAREANNDDVALLEICYAYLGPERQIMMTFLC